MRQSRKMDHLKYCLELPDGPSSNHFGDVSLIHNCLPNINWQDVSLNGSVCKIDFHHPIIINAITGGAEDVTAVNGSLAELAARTNSIMAVGSQYAAFECFETRNSFQIVRKKNPNGVIWANLGAHVQPEQAIEAVDMLNAQALQIHLNTAQELIMREGDRQFFGYLKNIESIISRVQVPVIVKEVGCGIAFEQAQMIAAVGASAIDIGGTGGTNFLAIEAARSQYSISHDFLNWGIPTMISTLEVLSATQGTSVDIIISGGIRTPLEAIKGLVLGGKALGIAGTILKLLKEGVDNAESWINNFLHEMKIYMVLLGVSNLFQLCDIPAVISGHSKEWLMQRGIDTQQYALRKKHG